jgi:hypothetical protein
MAIVLFAADGHEELPFRDGARVDGHAIEHASGAP